MELSMGIIKFEVNFRELKESVEGLRNNRIKLFEDLTLEVKQAVVTTINQVLNSEMTLFLGKADQIENKRNGFEVRDYVFKGLGSLRIKMPVDRKRGFKSEIILPREKIDPRIQEDLAVLHLAGISTRTIEMISRRIFGEDLSKNNIRVGLKKIEPKAKEFLNRRLDENKYWALFVDGTNFRMRRSGTVSSEPTLVVLAVDRSNCLSIIGAEPGYKDDKTSWDSMFGSLKERGLNAASIQIGVMDGLPGLEAVFKENFPNSKTARCWVHAMKNSYAKVSKKLLPAYQKELQKVMYANSEQSARESFSNIKIQYGANCERAVKVIEKDLNALLVHYQFDQSLWRALKTTNAIERVNKEFKRRTKSMEQIGENTLQILLAFTALRLEMNWKKVPINSPILSNLNYNKKNYLEQSIGALLN